MDQYKDRQQAGIILSTYLKKYEHNQQTIVLALPRGGVPVAYEVAKALHLPLDIFIVRKLGFPGNEEYAMGAIASGNTVFLNNNVINDLSVSKLAINSVIDAQRKELTRREQLYRGERPFPDLSNKTVILIDDGIATGASLHAAILGLNKLKVGRIVVAVPVAPLSSINEIEPLVDEIICPLKPVDFHAVGLWYQDFSQTSDEEVIQLLS